MLFPVALAQSDEYLYENHDENVEEEEIFITGPKPVNDIKQKPLGFDDDITSTLTLYVVEQVIFYYINPALMLFGCPTNLICIFIFCKRGFRKDPINICMTVLAVLNFLTIFTWFSMNFVFFLSIAGEEKEYLQWSLRNFFRGPHHGFLFGGGFLVALISVERFVSVGFPMKAASILSWKTTVVIIVVVNVIVQLICSSFTVTVNVLWVNGTTYLPRTKFYQNHKDLVDWTQNFVAMFFLPLVTMVIVTLASAGTVLELNRSLKWKAQAPDGKKSNAQITLVHMLMVVAMIYIITNFPCLILSVFRFHWSSTFKIGGKYHNTFMAAHISYWTLGSFNSTVNFFVYFTHCLRFRYECIALLPKSCLKPVAHLFGMELKYCTTEVEISGGPKRKHSSVTRFSTVFDTQATQMLSRDPCSEDKLPTPKLSSISLTPSANRQGIVSECTSLWEASETTPNQRRTAPFSGKSPTVQFHVGSRDPDQDSLSSAVDANDLGGTGTVTYRRPGAPATSIGHGGSPVPRMPSSSAEEKVQLPDVQDQLTEPESHGQGSGQTKPECSTRESKGFETVSPSLTGVNVEPKQTEQQNHQ